jgi:PucR family transcriptional regulator, purine catabolism regulatory protein
MCIDGASATDIVSELARICGCPAVLENLVHQVIAYEPGNLSPRQLLERWESRSRDASAGGDLSTYGPEAWLAAWIEVRGGTSGRLVILPTPEPTHSQAIALKRAATALALTRLLEQNQSTLERQAHRSTVVDIIEHRYRSAADMYARTAALGVPTKNRVLIAIVVDLLGVSVAATTGARGSAADTVADAVTEARISALVSDLRRGRVGVLLSLAPHEDRKAALTRFVRDLKKRGQGWADSQLIVAAGSNALELDQVARSFAEAHQVADAARGAGTEKLYYELPDIQLRGLLHVLGDDPRLQSFVERTLGTLLDFDRRNDSNLIDCLRTFLVQGGNKSAAAEAAHVARQTFYRRLATVQRILAMDLESAEVRTSLHAAIMALESQRLRRQDRAENVSSTRSRQVVVRRDNSTLESAW